MADQTHRARPQFRPGGPGHRPVRVVRSMTAVRGHRAGRGLIANSIALLATSHITTVLGYLFWMVCAKGSSASTIGMTNTVISAISLVAVLTATGFEPFLTRVLPGADSEQRSGLCGT